MKSTIEQLITFIGREINYLGTVPKLQYKLEQMQDIQEVLRRVKSDKGLFALRDRAEDAVKADRLDEAEKALKRIAEFDLREGDPSDQAREYFLSK